LSIFSSPPEPQEINGVLESAKTCRSCAPKADHGLSGLGVLIELLQAFTYALGMLARLAGMGSSRTRPPVQEDTVTRPFSGQKQSDAGSLQRPRCFEGLRRLVLELDQQHSARTAWRGRSQIACADHVEGGGPAARPSVRGSWRPGRRSSPGSGGCGYLVLMRRSAASITVERPLWSRS
jgi:hypothetical protein